ncbi:hypothetical protein [Oceanicoccus sagamiensis]|uniref:Uncharacterized protein n=1 Tax=Oceanicoccus sagamiensis TaxID=716816 RepID=A0A1X9NAS7_9GAMM|nr:hypothetical protein [Oceanicoccus sagamiensis]ARN75150.1 hypothetical protein BST96_14115 [Oceanicoccus sagamiensis]
MRYLALVFIVSLLAACSSQEEKQVTSIPAIRIAVDAQLANQLVNFPNVEWVVVEDIADPLLDGRAALAISQQKLSDDVMGRFQARHGERPAVSIFTAPLPDNQNSQDVYSRGEQLIKNPWYLYHLTNPTQQLAALPESQQEQGVSLIRQQLAWLFSDQAQQQLADRGLLSLPEPLRQRARVALGLEAAAYQGGYR